MQRESSEPARPCDKVWRASERRVGASRDIILRWAVRADEKTNSAAENGRPESRPLLNRPHIIRGNHSQPRHHCRLRHRLRRRPHHPKGIDRCQMCQKVARSELRPVPNVTTIAESATLTWGITALAAGGLRNPYGPSPQDGGQVKIGATSQQLQQYSQILIAG